MSRDLERRLARLKRKGWVLEVDEACAMRVCGALVGDGKGHKIVLRRIVIVMAGKHPKKPRGSARDNALKHAIEDAER